MIDISSNVARKRATYDETANRPGTSGALILTKGVRPFTFELLIMFIPVTSRRRLIGVFAAALAAVLPARGASLLERSPFVPAENASKPAATETPSLELRGIVSGMGEPIFNIYDPAKKTSVWVRANEPGDAFVIKSHNPESNTVTVEYQGRESTLGLPEGKINSSGSPALAAAMSPARVVTGYPAPSARPSLETREAEIKRLEAVAKEIERRRALRAQLTVPAGGR